MDSSEPRHTICSQADLTLDKLFARFQEAIEMAIAECDIHDLVTVESSPCQSLAARMQLLKVGGSENIIFTGINSSSVPSCASGLTFAP